VKKQEVGEGMSLQEYVEANLQNLKHIALLSSKAARYNRTISAYRAYAALAYSYNQYYADSEIEDGLLLLSQCLIRDKQTTVDILCNKVQSKRVVLFYYAFGLDVRGLAYIYLKALCECGYRVIYVTIASSRKSQPVIMEMLSIFDNVEIVYLSVLNGVKRIQELASIFVKYCPQDAFFYSTPSDIEGYVVFSYFVGKVTRYLINLTDHAFWLGTGITDYCLEFRNYGYYISERHRGIDSGKLLIQPYYPVVLKSTKFQGWPFNVKDKKVVFSGGSLYKTLGDPENRYYRMVDYILSKHSDVIFVYAGSGDDTELKKILNKYPSRAYHIDERKDLMELLYHSYLYLNTYPMGGGLMTQYAVMADCIPITFVTDDDMSGLLLNQNEAAIEYRDIEYMLKDIDRLLEDEEYYKKRKVKIKNQVISEDVFCNNLQQIVEQHTSQFKYNGEVFDTAEFRKSYVRRLNKQDIELCIANRHTLPLGLEYPWLFVKGFVRKMKNKLCNLN